MTDRIDELIQEVATRHGVALGRDDPILVLHTINERLLADSARAQQAALERHRQELEVLALRWGEEARARAEQVLNASLAASSRAMTRLLQDGAASVVAATRAEVDAVLGQAHASVQRARRLALLNLAASALALAAAVAALVHGLA